MRYITTKFINTKFVLFNAYTVINYDYNYYNYNNGKFF